MTKDDIFREIEKALTEKKNAEIRIEMLQLRLRFAAEANQEKTTKKATKDTYQEYCLKNRIVDEDDRQLILRRSMTREEVAEEIAESASTVYRLFKSGVLKPAPESRSTRILIDSISVYEYLQFGMRDVTSSKTENRNLDSRSPIQPVPKKTDFRND